LIPNANAELDLALGRNGARNNPETSRRCGGQCRVEDCHRQTEVGMIEGVEEFGPELDVEGFGDWDLLCQRQIDVMELGSVQAVAAQVAKGPLAGDSKGLGIDPPVGAGFL